MIKIAPSILAADLLHLEDEIRRVVDAGCDLLHIDVMDGHFVPNLTIGAPVVADIKKVTELPLDVHLMIENPEFSLDSFAECGADFLTFHIEATKHADRCVQRIKELNKKAGVALCPATPISALEELLPLVDIVLVMTVNPGWGGQKLIPYTLEKIRKLADIQKEKNYSYKISVDGGINASTLPLVLEAGTDVVVSGSSFFNGDLQWEK